MRQFFRLLVLFCLWSTANPTMADDAAPPVIDKRGAVLCQWNLVVMLRTTVTTCFAKPDENYIAALDWAIGEMDTFILRNSKTSKNMLAEMKKKLVTETVKQWAGSEQCIGHHDAIYPTQDMLDIQKFREGIRQLLAVDRPPVMNPCL